MLLLTATTDKIQVITSAATNVDVHVSYMDASNAVPPVVQGDTMGRTNTAITTAATTDILAAPAASEIRNVKYVNIRNKSTSTSNDVTVQFNQNGTLFELVKQTLLPGATLEFVEGVGWYVLASSSPALKNNSTSTVSAGFATDTYLAGSFIAFGSGAPIAGTTYRCIFDMTKTAAGTATPVITVRTGTAGTTADTSRATPTFGAGTAAAATGFFEVVCTFRSVGSGTAAVLVVNSSLRDLATTGLSSTIKATSAVSAGFDSTTASLGIGLSFNGGASFSGTCNLVRAELVI